jgi:hypothetical protein
MLGALLVTGLMAATANAVDPYQRTGVIDSRDSTAGVIVVNDAEYRLPAYLPVAGGSQQDLLPGRHVGFDVADSDPNLIEALWLLADAPPPSTE